MAALPSPKGGMLPPLSLGGIPGREQHELLKANHDLMKMYHELSQQYMTLMENHNKLLKSQSDKSTANMCGPESNNAGKRAAVKLGVIRLDYDYPPAPGDIDSPESFEYKVIYRVVPGLTFEMCQSGEMTDKVKQNFVDAVDWLLEQNVTGITGDCGFMMYFQKLARNCTSIPVFMSSLAILPAVTCAFNKDELIAIFTANSKTLLPMRDLIKDECGVDPEEQRFIMVGCQDVPGFEAVALGEKVNVQKVTPGIVRLARQTLNEHPKIRAIVLECTELPPYADALRSSTGLPVFDAITCCDFFLSGSMDNQRFGLQNWQNRWDGQQDAYCFGQHLTREETMELKTKAYVAEE